MEHDLVLEGRVVTRSGIDDLEVGVTDGKISEVRKQGLRGGRRLRTGSCLIFPGFIDAHVHLREPGWESKEDFRTGSEAAAHGGVTTVADMPNNPRPANSPEALLNKRRLADSRSLVGVELYSGVEPGRIDSIPKLAGGAAGYKIFMARSTGDGVFPEDRLLAAFEAISSTGKPVSVHCEDQKIIDERAKLLRGVDRPDVHCDIRSPEAEVSAVKVAVKRAEEVKGLRLNVCHLSVEDSLAVVEAARSRGAMVDCEATLHHLYFSRKAMLSNSLLRTNPPLRSESDRRALVEALGSGRISFLVTDHAPHLADEKMSEGLSGVPGLDDYGHVVSWLIKQGVDPSAILKVCAANPARFLGLSDRGEVGAGLRADITVLDLKSPEKVDADSLRTKCGWSPYEGETFPGRVRWTIRGGRTLVEDFEVAF